MVRRTAGLAVLASLAALLAAAPAGASTAHGVSVYNEFDQCSTEDTVTFTAGARERNDVTIGAADVFVEWPFFGPPCDDFYMQAATIEDPSATIRPSGTCRFTIQLTNRSVICPMDALEVSLGDMDDTLRVVPGAPRTSVSCGSGNDTVIGHAEVAPDCEKVLLG